MSDLSPYLTNGPLWGFLGVVLTTAGTMLVNRKKTVSDNSAATLAAVNAATKLLMDGLFDQVKAARADVERLTAHNAECDRKHREALCLIDELRLKIATLDRPRSD